MAVITKELKRLYQAQGLPISMKRTVGQEWGRVTYHPPMKRAAVLWINYTHAYKVLRRLLRDKPLTLHCHTVYIASENYVYSKLFSQLCNSMLTSVVLCKLWLTRMILCQTN